jgi:hypothetical protein
MKIPFVILFTLLMFALPAIAGSLPLAWEPNPEGDLAGYKLYYTKEETTNEQMIDVGNVTKHRLLDLTTGKFYLIEATAYDTAGNESDRSYGLRGKARFTPVTGFIISEEPFM